MTGFTALLIFIIIVIILWLVLSYQARKNKPDIAVHHEEPAKTVETFEEPVKAVEEAPAAPVEPMTAEATAEASKAEEAATVEAPAPAIPDDLTVLEGIGPKVNTILQQAGIQTFAQLASAEASHLHDILAANGMQYMDPASWPEQAKLAAEGKSEELKALQDSLKGGRRVG